MPSPKNRRPSTTGGRGSRRRTPAKAAAAPRVIQVRGTSLSSPGSWGSILPSAVGPETAVRVSAIFGIVRWIAQAVGICPMQIMQERPDGRRQKADLPCAYTLRKRPNRWQSAWDFYTLQAYWTALHGNGYARILPGDRGWMTQLIPLHPSRVVVEQNADYSLAYKFWNDKGIWEPLAQEQVLHWRWISDNGIVGHAPAEMNATSINLARQLDTAATAFWSNSARPDMVLETDEKIPDAAVDAIRDALQEAYGGAANRGRAAVLPKKTRLKPIESNSMEASQFQELRDAILPDVCRHWGVPSTLLGDAKMNKYSTVEQEHLSAQVWCLLPWARRMESPIDMALQPVYGENTYAKLDTRGILRADTAGRAALYQSLWNMGAITPNEIRDREDFELLDTEAANQTFVQLGFSTLDAAAAQAGAAGGEPTPVAADDSPDDQSSEGESVDQAGGFTLGQYVYFDGGEGTIEHLMTDGVLGVEGSPFAISASPDSPAASIRIHEGGQATEFTVGKRVSDLSADPMDGGENNTETPSQAGGLRFSSGQPRDPDGKFAGGGGGGGGSVGAGGSPGSGASGDSSPQDAGIASSQKQRKERLRDRIEGTQAEADREVKKAEKKLAGLKKKHDEIKAKLAAMGDPSAVAKKAYEDGLAKARDEKESKIAAARQKYEAKMAEIAKKYGGK